MSALDQLGTTSAYDIDVTTGTLMTADELLELPDDGLRHELVRGELRTMAPAGEAHGGVAAAIIASLFAYVKQQKLGRVYSSDTGFRIARNPDSVRSPDAAFVRQERVVETPKYFEGPPDLAVEVVSPNDRYSAVQEKTLEWLRAGVRAVVIVDPQTRRAHVHRAGASTPVVDVIQVEEILPGWRLPLAELFEA